MAYERVHPSTRGPHCSEKKKRAMCELALNPNYEPSADVKDPSREKAKINYQLGFLTLHLSYTNE